jgi:hypothetical protein
MTDPRPADGGRPVRRSAGELAAARRARERPIAERLELALSWNAVAAELRAGVQAARGDRARAE